MKASAQKSFSDYTVSELRSQPFSRVFNLFFTEVSETLKKSKPTKKKRGRPKKAAHPKKQKHTGEETVVFSLKNTY